MLIEVNLEVDTLDDEVVDIIVIYFRKDCIYLLCFLNKDRSCSFLHLKLLMCSLVSSRKDAILFLESV